MPLSAGIDLMLLEVDGKPGPNWTGIGGPRSYNSKWDGRFKLKMAPGVHTFLVTVVQNGALAQPPKSITANIEPGKTYTIFKVFEEGDWQPAFQEEE